MGLKTKPPRPWWQKLLPRTRKPYRLACWWTLRQTAYRVAAGPFEGMHYVRQSVCSSHEPKILGTYELELFPIVSSWEADRFDRIVNVGAGEGYYAVGLALRHPGAEVVAFEADVRGRELLDVQTRLNGVEERIHVRGLCQPEELQAALATASRPLLVIDVEGAERELLDPEAIPDLARTTVLVEVHDFVDREVGDLLLQRFASTHDVEEIAERPRRIEDIPDWLRHKAKPTPKRYLLRMMREGRPEPMRWFHFVPRQEPTPAA